MGLKEFKQGSVVAANKKISFMGVFIPVNVALGATQPLLPLLVLQVGGNVADVGLISSAYSLLSVFSSRFWGSVSDRVGKRKPFIVLGFASTGFILTLFSFASKVWQLILLNALMGFLTTAYIPSASMLIIEGSSKKEWTSRLSVYNLFNGVGWSLGLAVGALWLTFGSLKTLLWVLALFSIAGAVMSTHVIKEPFITIERYAITSFALEIVDHIRYIPTLMFNLPRLFNPFRWSKMIKLALVRDLPLFYSSTIVFFTAFS
ncbi:MAG: MFS transporter, partial [Candidatus Bathyarchaeia archaeon]